MRPAHLLPSNFPNILTVNCSLNSQLHKAKSGPAIKVAVPLSDHDGWCNECFAEQYFNVLIAHTFSGALGCFSLNRLTKDLLYSPAPSTQLEN